MKFTKIEIIIASLVALAAVSYGGYRYYQGLVNSYKVADKYTKLESGKFRFRSIEDNKLRAIMLRSNNCEYCDGMKESLDAVAREFRPLKYGVINLEMQMVPKFKWPKVLPLTLILRGNSIVAAIKGKPPKERLMKFIKKIDKEL